MAGEVLDITDFIQPDNYGFQIANFQMTWEEFRAEKEREWSEVQQYIFATDTTKTSNSKLPWNNKTTLPKLCQIRDNLLANYIAAMFPKQKWLKWIGSTQEDADFDKKRAIEAFMYWAIETSDFYEEMTKLVLDYIDYGNCFAYVEWMDERVESEDRDQIGYVGPVIRRISPFDIVMNPIAPSVMSSPKIVKSLLTMGEAKKMLEQMTQEDGMLEDAETIFNYLRKVRVSVADFTGNLTYKDNIYQVAGFNNFRDYLGSNYVEVLTFYGDLFNEDTGEFLQNYILKVIDRHKVIAKRPNPTFFGKPPIYHAGWRVRQDNLWAMGPLDNLLGMQYRIDHLENLKADCFDQIAFPPLKVRGYVEEFEWGPFERIYVGDDGDVEVMSPDAQVLQADNQIAILEAKMEEMAGAPKEAMGFRTPGEKTKYEVQRLENAASRIFQNKIAQFERRLVEPLINAMLELARRKLDPTFVRAFDNDLKIDKFLELTKEDITGKGRLKPIAARHFAEQATLVQDLNNFFGSPAGQDPDVIIHFSGYRTARLWENVLNLEDFNIVEENVRLSEKADAQQAINAHAENIAATGAQPSSGGVPLPPEEV
jgi:hypothetical protein